MSSRTTGTYKAVEETLKKITSKISELLCNVDECINRKIDGINGNIKKAIKDIRNMKDIIHKFQQETFAETILIKKRVSKLLKGDIERIKKGVDEFDMLN